MKGYPSCLSGTLSHRFLLTSAFLAFAVSATSVGAQSIETRAGQQADQIVRDQSEQLRQQQNRMQESLRKAPSGEAPAGPSRQNAAGKGVCVMVHVIEVTGATLVPRERIDAVVQPWQGRCLGLGEINGVLQAVTYLYIERGYVASRAFLPEQDLSRGKLAIKVVEGRLGEIARKGGGGTAGEIATAFPGLVGKPVNLREIEQGLDQINRLSSMKATVGLEPGKEIGDSVLGVTIDHTKLWSATMDADTYGTPSTGIYESRVGFGLDSPLGLNDAWSVSYQRSMNNSPLFFSGDTPSSDMVAGSFSIPYGWFTAGIDGSLSQYHSSIQGQVSAIDTSGRSTSVSPYLTWLIDRNQVSKTWMTGRLTRKTTDNFVLGSRIDTASRTLSVASLDLGHSHQFLGGTLNADLGYQQGLSILGAFDNATAPAGSPKGQFGKVTASLGYTRAEELGPGSVSVSSLLSGQWSNDPLFASEQMALGGFYSVRGTRDALLAGSTAFSVRNELSYLLPQADTTDLAAAFGRIEPYVALDLGRSLANVDDGSLGGVMTGGTVGIRNRGGRIGFELSYARILSIDAASENIRRPDGLVQGRVSFQF